MRRASSFLALVISCTGQSPAGVTTAPAASSATAQAVVAPAGAKPLAPEASDALRDVARKLAGDILVGDRTMRTLVELTDGFGPRLSGSDAHRRAADWALARFRSEGLDAALEPFQLQHSWTRGQARGAIAAPFERPLHVEAYGWTPPTPPGGLRAEVVRADDLSADGVKNARPKLEGKIAFFDTRAAKDAPRNIAWRLLQAGAASVVCRWDQPGNLVMALACHGPKGALCDRPVFGVGDEDGASIARALDAGAVTLKLESSASVGGPVDVPNVVAEIRGREKPDEMVLLGAHLDSWDFATGAQDDGGGAAQVLEAARAIRALGAPARRTIRFVLWGGEEEEMLGSRAYLDAHAAELDRFVAYVNSDSGAGAPRTFGYSDPRALDAVRPLLSPLLGSICQRGVGRLMTDCDGDYCSFWTRGVPSLDLFVSDFDAYERIHHYATDTVDKVVGPQLAQGAAALAIAAYAIADAPERLAPRASHAQIASWWKGDDALAGATNRGMWTP